MNEFVGAASSTTSAGAGVGGVLRRQRKLRGWSQEAAAHRFAEVAHRLGIPVADHDSLRGTFSRWENGHQTPDAESLAVLQHLYALTPEDFGDDRDPDLYGELRSRIGSAARVDHAFVRLLAENTENLRLRDRTFGAAMLFDQVGGHVRETERHLHDSLQPSVQRELAEVLADAAAMAGWQALDAGAVSHAWSYYQVAEDAAREAENNVLLAHAKAERAQLLLEAGDPASAAQLIQNAAELPGLPALLKAWLAAAVGECAAVAGDFNGTISAFDAASDLLPPTDAGHELLPFLVLDEAHLARWRGSALAKLAHPEAVDELTSVLERIDTEVFVRATAGMHTDLAAAYARNGDRSEARKHQRQGMELAAQIGSKRLITRLRGIRLPLDAEDAQ